ncbi:MAG: hypothetical protein L0Z73_08775 [Gammaproteobacteria bacterium]|nr:hypothetical protein [Gammaproteobacteria bacterium]
MNKKISKIVAGIILISGFNAANAELFVNPVTKAATGAKEVSAHFGASSVDYEVDGTSGDIDRTFLGATIAYGMNKSIDIYGTANYTLEAEVENFPDDGSGFMLGAGIRGVIPNNAGVSLHGYAQFLLIDESYGGSPEIEGEEMSIMAGVVAATALNNDIKLYGGLELNLMSDMEIESVDADRDDFLGIRLGANFNAGSFLINVNISLMHETGFFIGASKPF